MARTDFLPASGVATRVTIKSFPVQSRPGLEGLEWDAWSKLKGTSQEAGMQQYIDLINELSRAGLSQVLFSSRPGFSRLRPPWGQVPAGPARQNPAVLSI
ncbi:MAG: acyl-CoA-binding protein [Burkholderiales bacterium]|nr:acyl-CoA-binding protein [Burkholderiales bacterium]